MRRTRRHRRSKQKKFLIIGSLSLLLFLCVGYAAFSTNLSLKAKGNIKEKTRVIQSWDENSQTDFHSDFYKQNIVSATFLDNNDVPSNATESWNVSEDKENGGVMAWVVPNNNDNTKYDLYIGAKSGVIANEDSGYLFYYFLGLTSIEFNNNFDTSNAIKMNHMFYYCNNIMKLDLSSFDTSNITTMASMFDGCKNLTEINISNFDTSNVTDMNNMFLWVNVINLDVSSFNTSKVVNMQGMFAYCPSLQTINFGNNFNTSSVTNMSYMFNKDSSLIELDLNGFDTSNVENMEYMFTECNNLTKIDLCSFNTSKVKNFQAIFAITNKLTQIKVGPNWTTSNANNTADMFYNSGVTSVTTGQC